EDVRAGGGARVLGGEHVLDAEREAFERPRVARLEARIRRLRHRTRALRGLQHIGVERTRLLHGGKVRVGELRGGEFSPPKAVACVRERQRCEIGHSSGLSQANALAARAGRFGSSCLGLLAAGWGGGRPSACKSSAVRPGGISPRARKSAHHRRKKYSCSSQARHIGVFIGPASWPPALRPMLCSASRDPRVSLRSPEDGGISRERLIPPPSAPQRNRPAPPARS